MTTKPTPRVRVPAKAAAGEMIEIKTLISHEMESGQRKDAKGETIPRKIINKFTASFNGKPVFAADWNPAISAKAVNHWPSPAAASPRPATIEGSGTRPSRCSPSRRNP